MKTFFKIAAAVILATALVACSSAQQAQMHQNVQQFNANVGQDVTQAQPVLKKLVCVDGKGAVIAAPALEASGNAGAGAIAGAAGAAAVQLECPPGSTQQAQ